MAERHSLYAQLVDLHYVDKPYHREHPQFLHQHNDVLELLYFAQGEGRYFVEDKIHLVQRGSLIVCNAQIKHGELPGWRNELESYCCVYQGLTLPELPPNTITKPSESVALHFMSEQTVLEHVILALYEQFRKTGVGNNVCHILGNAVLNLVYDRISSEKTQSRGDELVQNEVIVKEIITYIDEHLHEPMNLDAVAAHFYVSVSYFSHAVKKAIGISPMRYMLIRRIGEAQNLLMNTSLKVGKISESLGFEDNAYFSRSFKKLVGITPTEYRKKFLR